MPVVWPGERCTTMPGACNAENSSSTTPHYHWPLIVSGNVCICSMYQRTAQAARWFLDAALRDVYDSTHYHGVMGQRAGTNSGRQLSLTVWPAGCALPGWIDHPEGFNHTNTIPFPKNSK